MIRESRKLVMIVVDCTDFESRKGEMRSFDVHGLPTIVLTNSSGERVDSVEGDVPSGHLLEKFASLTR